MATGSGGVCGQDAGFARVVQTGAWAGGWEGGYIYLTAPENMRWIGAGPASHHAGPEPYICIYIHITRPCSSIRRLFFAQFGSIELP